MGINGVGINALAKFAAELGFETSGSDAHLTTLSNFTAGAYEGVDASRVDGAVMLAHTAAVGEDHPEIVRARELGIPVLSRQKLLGEVSALFERCAAVAGTHGKTTVTAMLAHILRGADKKFAAFIGGESADFCNFAINRLKFSLSEEERMGFVAHCAGVSDENYTSLKNKIVASGGALVTEACEYKRSFLELKPYVGVVTNMDLDHPDCYSSLKDVRDAFEEFLAKSRIKIFKDEYAKDNLCTIMLSGEGLCKRMSVSRDGKIAVDGKFARALKLPMGGEYNLQNALFAVGAAYALGVDVGAGVDALKNFAGVKRRFERAKDVRGTPAYFDFAHHPAEIACALERAREMGRVLVVFQPHTYSRTRAYLGDFAKTLGDGDGALILMPTYAAREPKEAGVDSDELERAIAKAYPNKRVLLVASHAQALNEAQKLAPQYDVVMFVGAGDIYAIKEML